MVTVKVWLLILTSIDGGVASVQLADKGSCIRAGVAAVNAGRPMYYSCTEVSVLK